MTNTGTVTADELAAAGVDAPFETVEEAVADGTNVAVVAEPYAGRAAVLDRTESLLGDEAERVRLTPAAPEGRAPAIPDAPAVVVDDCHYLYRRRVGGFEVLDRLVERMATDETLFVTSWNRYAWDYLAAVRGVDASFPERAALPDLDAAGVEALVRERFAVDDVAFVDTGKDGRIKTLNVGRRPVRLWGDRTASVPVPRPNPEWVRSWWTSDEDESIEAAVFEKVRRVSGGNPGAAAATFQRGVRAGEIAPAYVRGRAVEGDLTDETAFALLAVVSKGTLTRAALADVAGDGVDTTLAVLAQEGLVEVDGETVRVAPAGLGPAVAELRRRRLLW